MAIEILRQVAGRSMPFDIKDGDRDYNAMLLLRAAGLVTGLLVRDSTVDAPPSVSPVLRVLAVTPNGRLALERGYDQPATTGMCDRASSRLQR